MIYKNTVHNYYVHNNFIMILYIYMIYATNNITTLKNNGGFFIGKKRQIMLVATNTNLPLFVNKNL